MYQVRLQESYFPAQSDDGILDSTVGGILADAAAESPHAEALVEACDPSRPSLASGVGSTGRRWTFADLHRDAQRLADALLSRYEPGERIAIWSPNTPEWAIVEFAAGIAGLVLVTVNPAYKAKELAYVLKQSRSAGLFLIQEHRGNPLGEIARHVLAELPQLREIVDLDDDAALFATSPTRRDRPVVATNDAAQVVSRLKQFTKLPVALGFGISNAEHVKAVGEFADAAVIGSAIVQLIEKTAPEQAAEAVGKFVAGLRA